MDYARRVGAYDLPFLQEYFDELWRLCQKYGFAFEYLVGQGKNETGAWSKNNTNWTRLHNPAGLAITNSQNLSLNYKTGKDAARAHVVHHYVYRYGAVPDNTELIADIDLDGHYWEAVNGSNSVSGKPFAGSVRTIDDFNKNGTWALMDRQNTPTGSLNVYGTRILNDTRAVFGELPDQRPFDPDVETPSTPEEPIVAVKITQQMIPKGNRNRPGDKLNVAPLWITIHDTGNPGAGADAQMHATFVKNGGGESSVSFHGTVDDAEAIQLLPADEIGWHAGDGCDNRTTDLGCFQSFAIETCVNSDGNWTKTKANLVDFVAAIITGDPRIDYAGRKGQFSVDRIAQHNKWSGKHCPAKIRNEGSWNTIIAAIKAKVAEIEGGTTPAEPVYVDPEPMAPGTYVKNDRLFLEVNKDYTTTKATKPYKYADFKPTQQTGPEIPKGTKIKALHVVSDTGATSDLTLVIDALKVGDYQIKPGSRIDGKAVAS